jgi:hypothetical protein
MEIIQKNWTLNDSLSLIERVVLHNLKLYESFEDKVIYFEKYYNNLIKKVFNNKNYIVETYNRKFTRNLIMESTFDFQNEIKKTHNFIKKSIKFDTLLEQEMNVGTIVTQPRDTVGPQVASQKQAYNPETQKYETLTAKINRIGWDEFIKSLRDLVTNTYFKAVTFFTDLIPGPAGAASKVVGWMAWGVITLYDAHEVFIKNKIDKIPNLLADIMGFIVKYFNSATPPGIKEFIKNPNILGKVINKGVNKMYSDIAKYFYSQETLPFIYKILNMVNGAMSLLNQAVSWIEKQFNASITWLSGMIQKVIDFSKEIMNSIKNIYPDIDKPVKTQNTNKTSNKSGVNYKLDPGKI